MTRTNEPVPSPKSASASEQPGSATRPDPSSEEAKNEIASPEIMPDGVPQPNHVPAEGIALAAAVAGGALGAIAGPPGIVAGATLGGVIGAAIALTVERQNERDASHDEALDDQIGVTSGSIGEPSANKRPSIPPKPKVLSGVDPSPRPTKGK